MARRLPDLEEARRILATKRTRPQHRAARPLGGSLSPFLKGLESRFGAGPLLKARWREIAGEILSRRTEPVRVIKGRGGAPGVLEVRADGAAATILQHQAPDLLGRVNLFLGEGAVGKLRIVQGLVRPPGADASGATTAKPHTRNTPLSAAQEAKLRQGLADAPDGPLKSALERLGRAVIRRNGAD
jgi:hypothetical protein